MNTTSSKRIRRERRHKRIRSQVKGTATKPRLSVYRSNKSLYAQLIDDESNTTLVAVDTRKSKAKTPTERAKEIGLALAKEAAAKKITESVFDRGGFIFTGNIKTFAEAVREGGLEF